MKTYTIEDIRATMIEKMTSQTTLGLGAKIDLLVAETLFLETNKDPSAGTLAKQLVKMIEMIELIREGGGDG